MDEPNPTHWITTTEAAELTGYTPANFRQAIKRKRLTGKKRGRDWWLLKADVLTYAQEMKRLGSAKHNPMRHK